MKKQCILEFSDDGIPICKSLSGETIAFPVSWHVTNDIDYIQHNYGTTMGQSTMRMTLTMELSGDFLSKLQTVETQNVEPNTSKDVIEKFEHRAIAVS
jgi:hypothetical protein